MSCSTKAIVDGVRHGGDYYGVAAERACARGDYPMKPFVTFRLPTLAVVQAMLPGWAVIALLYALAAGVMLAWFARLRPAFARPPPLILAMVLLAGGMGAFVQSELASFHEVWAGLLIALSLALRRSGPLGRRRRDRRARDADPRDRRAVRRGHVRPRAGSRATARKRPAGRRRRVARHRRPRARARRGAGRPPARPRLAGLERDAGVRLLRRGDDAVDRAPPRADVARGAADGLHAVRLERVEATAPASARSRPSRSTPR